MKLAPILALLAMVALGACSSPEPYDYSALLAAKPRSILVLPPINNSLEVDASYACLSTVSVPLAERGYYVFPVALVDEMMKENGLPTPVEMHGVAPQKLREIIGADAALYLNVNQWGTSYQVLNSVTRVVVTAQLVDLRTGQVLWQGARSMSKGSHGGGLVESMVGALVNQVVSSISNPSVGLSSEAQFSLYGNEYNGLLPGPYRPAEDDS